MTDEADKNPRYVPEPLSYREQLERVRETLRRAGKESDEERQAS